MALHADVLKDQSESTNGTCKRMVGQEKNQRYLHKLLQKGLELAAIPEELSN